MFVFVCVLQRGVEVGKDRRLPTFVTSLKPKKRIRGFINTGSLTKLAQMFGNHFFATLQWFPLTSNRKNVQRARRYQALLYGFIKKLK